VELLLRKVILSAVGAGLVDNSGLKQDL